MPWCPACERFLAPPSVTPEGHCPECGRPVEPGRGRVASAEEPSAAVPPQEGDAPEEMAPVPLHLKVIGGATVAYLGWRLIQGVGWIIKHL